MILSAQDARGPEDSEKVAQQADQGQIGRRHRIAHELGGLHPFQRLAFARLGRAARASQYLEKIAQ